MSARRTVLVTGAGRGLGLAIAKGAILRGDVVVGTVRQAAGAPELMALQRENVARLHIVPLDVADPGSCAALLERVAGCVERVNVLFNNAGINSASHDVSDRRTAFDLDALDPDTIALMMRTNALGPILVTRALLPLLAQSATATSMARVVNISSRRASLHDKTTGGNYGYCMSKAALNMATRALGADALPFGVIVVAVHPGAVRTSMAQPDATLSAAEAAEKMLALADALGPAHAGLFLKNDGTEHPW